MIARRLWPWWAGLLAAFLTAQCGALTDSAPAPTAHNACPTIDDRLAAVLAAIDAGRVRHIAAVLAVDLDEPSQRAVVALILNLARALPPGAAETLTTSLHDERVAAVLPLLVSLLAPLPGDATAHPPKPPMVAEMKAFSRIAQRCLTADLFALVSDLLRDPQTPALLNRLLADIVNGGPQIREALGHGGVNGRAGFLALLHNVLTSVSAADFAPLPLVEALDGLRNPQQPSVLDALADLLHVALLLPTGQPAPKHVQTVSAVAACFLASDPSMTAVGLVYDALLEGPATITAMPQPTTETNAAMATALPIWADLSDVLVQSEASRDAAAELLGLLLRPEIATAALPELIALLTPATIDGVLALLGDLLTHPCPAVAAP